MFIKENGIIKPVTPSVKVDSSIKNVKGVWAMIDGSIKKIWEKSSESGGGLIGEVSLLSSFSTSGSIGKVQFAINNYEFIATDGYYIRRFSVNSDGTLSLGNSYMRPNALSGHEFNVVAGFKPFDPFEEIKAYISSTIRNTHEEYIFNRNLGVISIITHSRSTSTSTAYWTVSACWTKYGMVRILRSYDSSRYAVEYPSGGRSTNYSSSVSNLVVSPDGEYVAYMVGTTLYVYKITELSQTLMGTFSINPDPNILFFSPDGEYILYGQKGTPGTKFLSFKAGIKSVNMAKTDGILVGTHYIPISKHFLRNGATYVASITNGISPYRLEIHINKLSSEGISLISTVTIPVSGRPFSYDISHDGKYLVVGYYSGGGIQVYTIN